MIRHYWLPIESIIFTIGSICAQGPDAESIFPFTETLDPENLLSKVQFWRRRNRDTNPLITTCTTWLP